MTGTSFRLRALGDGLFPLIDRTSVELLSPRIRAILTEYVNEDDEYRDSDDTAVPQLSSKPSGSSLSGVLDDPFVTTNDEKVRKSHFARNRMIVLCLNVRLAHLSKMCLCHHVRLPRRTVKRILRRSHRRML
jgi:hypothetical protein